MLGGKFRALHHNVSRPDVTFWQLKCHLTRVPVGVCVSVCVGGWVVPVCECGVCLGGCVFGCVYVWVGVCVCRLFNVVSHQDVLASLAKFRNDPLLSPTCNVHLFDKISVSKPICTLCADMKFTLCGKT